jgi:hypothetical protein
MIFFFILGLLWLFSLCAYVSDAWCEKDRPCWDLFSRFLAMTGILVMMFVVFTQNDGTSSGSPSRFSPSSTPVIGRVTAPRMVQ